MNFKEGNIYEGFLLKKREYIKEIESDGLLFIHDKTKAKLVAVKNNDKNKAFFIAFKTLVDDSTGVPHILEHSVLSGSRKYPIKDVFSEITKGGLTTFLNAFTSVDMTMYPFSTRNEKEYFNIMDIYMDSVLHPLLKKNTFMREGWYYDISDRKDPLKLNGIVYNEMKGAYSNPNELLRNGIFKTLMPESSYAHNTGGDPLEIPDLTYEQFVRYHKKYYHPSNSTLYVYGNADLIKELKFINGVLDEFDYDDSVIEVVEHEPLKKPEYFTDTYSIDADTSKDEKTYHAIASMIGDFSDIPRKFSFSLLSTLLHHTNASPLKQAIIEADICNDYSGYYMSMVRNTFFITNIAGSEMKYRDRFIDIYYDTLKDIVKNGFDKNLILSELNKFEFHLRQKNSSALRGFEYGYNLLKICMHYTDGLFDELRYTHVLDNLKKEALENRHLEKLIEQYLLNNSETVFASLEPDPQKSARISDSIKERLAKEKDKMENEEVDNIIIETKNLIEESNMNVSEEELKVIPKLAREDIEDEINFHTLIEDKVDDIPILISDLYTNQIIYLEIGFKVDSLSKEELNILTLFSSLLTELGTKDISYNELSIIKSKITGDLSAYFKAYSHIEDKTKLNKYFWIRLSTTRQYLEKSLELLSDLILNTTFEDEKKIKDIIDKIFIRTEKELSSEGVRIPMFRLKSYLGIRGKYEEAVYGYSSFKYLKELRNNYESRKGQLKEKFLGIKDKLFNKCNMILHITSEEGLNKEFLKKAYILTDKIKNKSFPKEELVFDEIIPNEAFLTPAEVVFAYLGTNLYDTGLKYHGRIEVLKKFLSRDYLYKHIRVIGGAYGCHASINSLTGALVIGSYRDPNVKKTYEAYNMIPKDIENFSTGDELFFQYLVGAYSAFDLHLDPDIKAVLTKNEYMSGVDNNFKNRIVKEILSTNQQDIRDLSPYLKKAFDNSYRCIIGSRDKIMEDKELFDELITI